MNCRSVCRFAALVATGSFVFSAVAAEIAYTGEGASGDLADVANWTGGAVPGEGDVGVVDAATYGLSYSISTNAFLGGLRFAGSTGVVTIESSNTLSLGSGGLAVATANGITFKIPLATTAAQTWDFGTGPAKFYKTISGTADLTLTNAKGLWHYWSPRYDGKIVYTSISTWNNTNYSKPTNINFYEPDVKWANEISASCQIRFLFSGRVSFATLFPGMSPIALGSASFGLEKVSNEGGAGGAGYPTGYVADGEDISLSTFVVGGGPVYQTGGALNVSGTFHVGNVWYYDYSYNTACEYFLSGGSVVATIMNIGKYAKCVDRYVQSGGDTTVTDTLKMGGGNQTDRTHLSEYRLDGGSLTVQGASGEKNNAGAVLYFPDDQMGYARAFIDMRGGTFTTDRIMFGINSSRWYTPKFSTGNGCSMPCHDTYGLFDMTDGVLYLGRGGIVTGANWNPDGWTGGVTNSFADARLRGGKVVSTATSGSTAPIRLPNAGGSLEWKTEPDTTASVFSPVSGEGELVKSGAGTLALTDATAFKGSVNVKEGTLRLLGTSNAADSDCWLWRADDLVTAGCTNLERIATWTDARHGVPATNTVIHLATRDDVAYSSPSLRHNEFNGHAALRFDNSILVVPSDLNPLVDADELTIAIVYRMDNDGTASLTGGKYYDINTHMLSGSWGYYNNAWAPWFNWVSGSRLQFTVDSGADGATTEAHRVTSAEGVSLKGTVHVSIGSVSTNGISLMTDGAVTNRPWTGTYRKLFTHKSNSSTKLPLVIGSMFSDSDNARGTADMSLAEVRLYRTAMKPAEQGALSAELSSKYCGYASAVASCVDGMKGAVAGELAKPAKPAVAEVPGIGKCWQADSLAANLADGADVTSWATTNGTSALTVEEGFNAPKLVLDAANGHAAVRFDAANRTVLSAQATTALNIDDWNNWTIAVVFRTSQGATGYSTVTDGKGIVSIMKNRTSNNCFQFAMITNGELRAYCTTDKSIYLRRPLHLNDGQPHVAVFTSDMARQYNGSQADLIVIDGVTNLYSPGVNPELTKKDSGFKLSLGRLVEDLGLFSGDIMEVRWYCLGSGKTHTLDQAKALCAELADKYGVRLFESEVFGYGQTKAGGLGATNVTVAAGAKLSLPLARTSPYEVTDGNVIDLKGDVEGTLSLTDGATLRLSAYGDAAVSIEDVWVSGTVSFDLANLPDLVRNRKLRLFRTGNLKLAEGAKVVIPGVDESISRLVFDEATGSVVLRSTFGSSILIR